jgi:hypothetical protein
LIQCFAPLAGHVSAVLKVNELLHTEGMFLLASMHAKIKTKHRGERFVATAVVNTLPESLATIPPRAIFLLP